MTSAHRVVLLAVLVGGGSAGAVWFFKRMIEAAEWLSHERFADSWAAVPFPWVVLIPTLGGLLVGAILHLARIPDEPGHGVEEAIRTVALRERDFPARQTPVKAGAAAVSLGAGASLGPEDPAVEIGGSVGHWVARRLALPREAVRAMVAAGAASGLAAAFFAPFAAIVFTVEVFALRLLSRTVTGVAVAAITAYLVIRMISPGVQPVVPVHVLRSGWELVLCIGLGLIAGALAAGQIRLMYRVEHAFLGWRAVPRWAKPALGGLVLGCAGLVLPQLLGIGYATLEPLLAGEMPGVGLLLAMALGKAVLMVVSFGSGFIGGFFAPPFFIGAAVGAAYGSVAHAALPALALSPPTFAAVGMAAFLAGAVRAPFAAALLVPALSGSYALVPALLLATLTAYWTSRWIERHSLYTYGIEHPPKAALLSSSPLSDGPDRGDESRRAE